MYISNDQYIVEIEGIYFIRLDLRGIKRAVNYNHKNKLYNTFVSIIIADTIISKFNGTGICFPNKLQPWLFANAQWYRQNFGGFSFFDFSYLNVEDLMFRLDKK